MIRVLNENILERVYNLLDRFLGKYVVLDHDYDLDKIRITLKYRSQIDRLLDFCDEHGLKVEQRRDDPMTFYVYI